MLSQLMVLFGFFALVLVSVYWVNQAVSLFNALLGDGQSVRVFLEFTALTLPTVMSEVLPVAAFVATLYAVNRMINESEFVVLQAIGVSGMRLAVPVVLFGLIVALILAALLHHLVPQSRAQLLDRRGEIAENIAAQLLREGRFLHPTQGVTVYIGEITPQGALRDLFLSDSREGAQEAIYTAREALLVRDAEAGPQLVMLDGMVQTRSEPGRRLDMTAFESLSYDLATLIGQGAPRPPVPREMTTARILQVARGLDAAQDVTPQQAWREIHLRIAQPLMAPAAVLIGFATLILGSFSRLGIWRQVLGAVALVIALQMLNTWILGTVGRNSALAPLVHLPPLGGIGVAMGMLWLSTRPHWMARAGIALRARLARGGRSAAPAPPPPGGGAP